MPDSPPETPVDALRSEVHGKLCGDMARLALVTLLVGFASLFLFEQITGARRPLSPLLYLGGSALAALLPAAWMVRRLLRRSLRSEPPRLRALVNLPRDLAATHLVAWLGIGLLAAALTLVVERFRPDRSFMIFLASVLAGVGAGLVALVATSGRLGRLWPHLAAQAPRTSLRQKITLVLGGVVFFSSAFGLFSSFAVQREIVSYYARQQGRELERTLVRQVEAGTAPCAALATMAPADGSLVLAGVDFRCRAGSGLSEAREGALLRAPDGRLSVPGANLEGVKRSLPEFDLVLVSLLPKPEWAQRVLLVSLAFYTLLFLFSAFLATQVARDLTTPIEGLRKQMKRLEAGELEQAVVPTSVDELGDLAASTEAMRRGLRELVETVRSLNLTLEEKVELRTVELARANEELTATLTRLQEAQAQLVHAEKMASLGRLMSGLAHELNNPVNAILNTAGPLRKGLANLSDQTPPDRRKRLLQAAETVEHAARRTVGLIHSLSTFSRHGEEDRKPLAIQAALEATAALLRHRLDALGCRLLIEADDLPEIRGHPGEINQVFMNLMANAIDAVAAQGNEGLVTVRALPLEEGVEIRVEDNGAGIPEAVRERVFEPFFTTRDEGVGLGLAISHQIVERHGGSLTFAPRPERGTTFRLYLPLAPP